MFRIDVFYCVLSSMYLMCSCRCAMVLVICNIHIIDSICDAYKHVETRTIESEQTNLLPHIFSNTNFQTSNISSSSISWFLLIENFCMIFRTKSANQIMSIFELSITRYSYCIHFKNILHNWTIDYVFYLFVANSNDSLKYDF